MIALLTSTVLYEHLANQLYGNDVERKSAPQESCDLMQTLAGLGFQSYDDHDVILKGITEKENFNEVI